MPWPVPCACGRRPSALPAGPGSAGAVAAGMGTGIGRGLRLRLRLRGLPVAAAAAIAALAASIPALPARAQFECRVAVVVATGAPQPDRSAAARAAFRAWEVAAAPLGHPYRWLLARELPGQPEFATTGQGLVATVRAHPCIVGRGAPPAACGTHADPEAARSAGCAVFFPLGR